MNTKQIHIEIHFNNRNFKFRSPQKLHFAKNTLIQFSGVYNKGFIDI